MRRDKHLIEIVSVEEAKKEKSFWLMKTKMDAPDKKGVQRQILGKIVNLAKTNGYTVRCDIFTDQWYEQEEVFVRRDGSFSLCPEFGSLNHKVRLRLKKEGMVIDEVVFKVRIIKYR